MIQGNELTVKEYTPVTSQFRHRDTVLESAIGWFTNDRPCASCLACQAGVCIQKVLYDEEMICILHGSYSA